MKQYFKSKTVWLGIAVGALGLVQATLAASPMDTSYSGAVLGGIGALIVWLRSMTVTPISAK
jgi:hypothetical protein